MKLLKQFAKRMKQARVAQGKTYYGMSIASGVHPTTLSTIERDARDLRLSNYVKICEALNLDPGKTLNEVNK
jgi:transcriptional regulator with XRE-family HTH domain